MKKIKYVIITAVIMAFGFGAAVCADNEDRPQFDDSTVIVIMKPQNTGIRLYSAQPASNSAYSVFDELGVTDIEKIASIPSENTSKGAVSLFSVSAVSADKDILKLTLPERGEENVLAAVTKLNDLGTVEYAQPDYFYYLDSIPNDPRYSLTDSNTGLYQQYNLRTINAEAVWDMNISCKDVTVAVIDSGMLMTHQDLNPNLWTDTDGETHGYDFENKTSAVTDSIGHGTHVAGIIGAKTNNSLGIASLTGDVKLAPLKVFDSEGGSNSSWIISALEYVQRKQFPIVNCSWGATFYGTSDDDAAVKALFESMTGTLFVVAAGNDNKNNDEIDYYPATYGFDNIITVAATDENDKLAKFYDSGRYVGASSYGAESVDIAAPGKGIWSTYKNGDYVSMQGTSQATPLVASAAAVIKAKYPSLTPAQIKQAILDGADTVSALEGKINGARRLNAYGALAYASELYCTVTWMDDDGNVIDRTEVPKGTIPSHETPSKESDDLYDYIFTGWSPEIEPAEEDIEYTAQFQPISRAAPREPIRVLDKFTGKFYIEMTLTDSDTILISIIPDEDTTGELPGFSAYVAVYNNGEELEKIQKVDFKSSIAEIKAGAEKKCRLFIWTDKNEPVIMPVNDVFAFINAPSQ